MDIKSLKESEKEHLVDVLSRTHWDIEKTARLLKISLNRLKTKIRSYGLHPPDPQAPDQIDNGPKKGDHQ